MQTKTESVERVKKIQAKLRQYDRWFTEEYEHPDFQRLYWELLWALDLLKTKL